MNDNTTEIPPINHDMASRAVSVYGQQDALDDFPVLKAFQQYIDAEQAKSRKRLVLLCIFFSCLMFVVIAVFVGLLFSVSSKNQALNDRLIDYAMNRDRMPAAGSQVVVQPSHDSAAIMALTSKLEGLQKQLAEEKVKAAAAAEAAREASQKANEPTPEEREITRLKAQLAIEKEKNAIEKKRQRQAELEAYRRKHYPELYEPKVKKEDEELDDLIQDITARTYFEEDQEDAEKTQVKPKKTESKKTESEEKEYSIPVDVKGSSVRWTIPED